jgi:hypothetical protein
VSRRKFILRHKDEVNKYIQISSNETTNVAAIFPARGASSVEVIGELEAAETNLRHCPDISLWEMKTYGFEGQFQHLPREREKSGNLRQNSNTCLQELKIIRI